MKEENQRRIQILSKVFALTSWDKIQWSFSKSVTLCSWATNQEYSQIMMTNIKSCCTKEIDLLRAKQEEKDRTANIICLSVRVC